MHDQSIDLRAGGIVPLGTKVPPDERASVVSARAFAHPAIAGRVVVKLTPDAIAAGVDAELDALGFGPPTVTPHLGMQRYRSLGFPGWALIHDPKRARFALEVTKEFKAAAKRARSKPGHAKDMFVAISERLGRSVPHFLPSYWEEAGRVFLNEENTTYAAQSFEKARQAEKEHALEVDEDARAATFLEFALAGAIAVKTLTAYAKDLAAVLGAKEGYERFRMVVVKRTLGGMPPWSGMAKDLRALAKGAGLDLAAEDERFLEEVLASPSLQRAPAEFWASYRPALVKLGKRSATARSQLVHIFPAAGFTAPAVATEFVTLLEETGALDEVVANAASAARGANAAWLSRLVAFVGNDRRVESLFERLAPHLREDGTVVAVGSANRWHPTLSLDLCELALGLGISLAAPAANGQFSLGYFTRDPVLTALDPQYGPKLDEAVGAVIGTDAFETRARGLQGFVTARRAWITRRVESVESAGVAGLRGAIKDLEARMSPAIFAEFPDLHARLTKARIAACVMRTLRGGIFDELGWPVYEAAFLELHGGVTTLAGAFPYLVVHSPLKAIVLSVRGRELVHDFQVNRATEELQGTFFLDGQLLVTYRTKTYESRAYWSGRPSESFKLDSYLSVWGSPRVTDVPGGGVTLGGKLVKAGDTSIPSFAKHVSDGTTFWRTFSEGSKLVLKEFDPRSDVDGRASWPRFAEEFLDDGKHLDVGAFSLAPAPPGLTSSPLGLRDGLIGTRSRRPTSGDLVECESIDGRKWSTRARAGECTPTALLRFPGDDRPRAVAEQASGYGYRRQTATTLLGPDGMPLGSVGSEAWFTRGWGKVSIPAPQFWHYLSPRDEAGSAALRATSEAVAEALVDAAREDVDVSLSDTRETPRTTAAVAKLLPGITDPNLLTGVVGVVVEAAECALLLEKKVVSRVPAAAVSALPQDPIGAEVSQLSDALSKGEHRPIGTTSIDWLSWLGNIRAFGLLSIAPVTSKEERDHIHQMLRALSTSCFADDLRCVRTFDALVTRESETGKRFAKETYAQPSPRTWSAGASHYYGRIGHSYSSPTKVCMIERTSDGNFRDPVDATVEAERRLSAPSDREWLAGFLEVVAPADPPAWDPAIAEKLAAATGLTRAEAVLLWLGAPNVGQGQSDFLGKARRGAVGLKVAEADVARDTFRAIPRADLLGMLSAAAAGDPADVLRPLEAGAKGTSVVGRLAAAWCAQHGERVALPEELIVVCDRELALNLPATALFGALAEPERSPVLKEDTRTVEKIHAWNAKPTPMGFDGRAIADVAVAIPYLALTLPVGDPWRSKIPRLYARVTELLASPTLLLSLGQKWSGDAERADLRRLLDALGGESVALAGGADYTHDAGTVVAAIVGHSASFGFRPARAPRLGEDEALFKLAASLHGGATALSAAAFLSSDGCRAIVDRIRATPVPAGKWEADPRASTPKTVKRVMKTLSLKDDAAVLYLQMLGLPEPTAKAVQRFNGWTPAVYKRAAEELAECGVVVGGKRERAGREIFLPGAWIKRTGKDLPIEAWKLSLYAMKRGALARTLPLAPIHEIMERAWKRVEDGDKPALEEVR